MIFGCSCIFDSHHRDVGMAGAVPTMGQSYDCDSAALSWPDILSRFVGMLLDDLALLRDAASPTVGVSPTTFSLSHTSPQLSASAKCKMRSAVVVGLR